MTVYGTASFHVVKMAPGPGLWPFHSQVQKVHSLNLFEERCISEVVRIGRKISFLLSKRGKAKFFKLCDVIFLVMLQGKFEIGHTDPAAAVFWHDLIRLQHWTAKKHLFFAMSSSDSIPSCNTSPCVSEQLSEQVATHRSHNALEGQSLHRILVQVSEAERSVIALSTTTLASASQDQVAQKQ